MPMRKADGSIVYQVEVILKECKPPIWRRFHMPGSLTLAQLHDALQIIMGWTDSHLHRFIINGQEFGRPDYEERFEDDDLLLDERRVHLADLLPVVPAAFIYEYDYGDCWLHVIVVERILSAQPGVHYPTCVEGERTCPPEDVGGVDGYEDLLVVIADPEHEEHESMQLWAGEDFDPEAFDVVAVNQTLRHL